MGQIEDLRLFVTVAEAGGISKAAESLNIAKSAVSRRLALLEDRYDARLIDRGPGLWAITETGRELLERATQAVSEVDEIEADFISNSADLAGPLMISIPRDFGLNYLGDALLGFKQQYPDIALTVDYDDRLIDLGRDNYDFAIRITGSEERTPRNRIGTVTHALYASSDYLTAHPAPERLQDLHSHRLLYFGTARRTNWEFLDIRGKPLGLEFQPFLNSNSGMFLLDATLKGLGIGRLPDFIAKPALAAGHLVPVLPDLQIQTWGIYLIHAENRRWNRRMRLFAEHIKAACVALQ